MLISLFIAWTLKAGRNDRQFFPRAACEDRCALKARDLYFSTIMVAV
jgi:hypothetical protein